MEKQILKLKYPFQSSDVCLCGHEKIMHLYPIGVIDDQENHSTLSWAYRMCSILKCNCKDYEDDFVTSVCKTRSVKEENEVE